MVGFIGIIELIEEVEIMDVDTFFVQIRQNLINFRSRELTNVGSASVQMTTWIKFMNEYENGIIDRVRG